MDGYLSIQGLQEVKVRVTDYRDNWTRSEDLIEGIERQGQAEGLDSNGNYTMLDLMFRDDNRYPDESDPCSYPNEYPPYRREKCDGYVMPRPSGVTAVDVIAVVSAHDPPDSIPVTLSAPTDEHGLVGVEQLTVLLYRLNENMCPTEWNDIFLDSLCAGKVGGPCVEIYFRYAAGRVFYNCPQDPLVVVASDSSVTTESSIENPVGCPETSPYLYVSSSDHMIVEPPDDFKDYSIAIGTGGDFENLIPFGADPIIWNAMQIPWEFEYGARRGWFENDVPYIQDPLHSVVLLNEYGDCGSDIANENYANFKNNVLTFGFETVKAECGGLEAFYPVQSEADIMLVHAHGDVNLNVPRKSYMMFFPENSSSPFFPCPQNESVLYADDWNSQITFNRDAGWLVATSCWLLARDYMEYIDPNTTILHQYVNVYGDWQNLVGRSTTLKSVLGWRWEHADAHDDNAGSPPGALHTSDISSTSFYRQFLALLNREYQGNENRWFNHDMPDDIGIICYMEAAHMWLEGELEEGIETFNPNWTPHYIDYVQQVAAVDASNWYIIEPNRDPSGEYDYLIFKQ
jgi:hypothetical protein